MKDKKQRKNNVVAGTVLALAMALSVGTVAFAATATQTKADNASDIQIQQDFNEYGNLTDAEITQLKGIYNRYEEIFDAVLGNNEEMTDDEFNSAIAPYQAELETLDAKAFELEKKAGWYGNLTDEENSQLDSLYDRVESIYEKAIGDNENMSDEELESALAQYKDELEGLEKQINNLEQKVGFVEAEGGN